MRRTSWARVDWNLFSMILILINYGLDKYLPEIYGIYENPYSQVEAE